MRTFVARWRIHISLGFSVLLIALVLASPPTVPVGATSAILKYLGLTLMLVAALGRIWCGIHISGHKTKHLVTTGPYALHRNPLYFYSFFGAIGFGLSARNLIVAGLVAVLFVAVYPAIVRTEESTLREFHGDEFEAYCKAVPRWLPRFRTPEQELHRSIHVRKLERSVLDAGAFIALFVIADLVYELHVAHVLPTVW